MTTDGYSSAYPVVAPSVGLVSPLQRPVYDDLPDIQRLCADADRTCAALGLPSPLDRAYGQPRPRN